MKRANGETVSVDEHFARFGSKSYAIDKINTVDVRVKRPHGLALFYISMLVAVVALAGAVGNRSPGNPSGSVSSSLVVAAVAGALALWAFLRSKKRVYQLFLVTSSSEQQAMQSESEDEVVELRAAVEAAMRGRRAM